MHLLLRDADRAPAHVLVRVELDLLEHGHLPGDHHLAALALASGSRIGLVEDLQNLQRDAEIGIGVVIDVGAGDVGLALLPVEPVDVVLHPFVDVDRLLVDEQGSGEEVHLAEHAVSVAGCVHDDHVFRGTAPQAEGAGRKVLVTPVVAVVLGVPHVAVLLQDVEQGRRLLDPEPFRSRNGQLECRGAQVVEEHVEVVRVHQPVLRGSVEKVVRMGRQELIDGCR